MKKVKIDNVWPHDIIKTETGIGQVASVEKIDEGSPPARVEFSWHEFGSQAQYFYWNAEVLVLSEEDLLKLRN